jgi:PAS domain S-box-containing protein
MSLADPAFRAIFEDSPIGIVIVDGDLKIIDVNAAYCDLVGYTEAEMMARHIPDFTHPEDRARDAEFAQLVLSGALPHYRAEKRYIRKSGEIVWASITVTALLDPSGVSRYTFSMAQSLTDRRALRGILPVCPSCHRVRDGRGDWRELENYLREQASSEVRHDLCAQCAAR